MNGRNPRAIKQRLESLADAGVQSLPKRGRTATTLSAPVVPQAEPPRTAAAAPAGDVADRVRSLAILRQQVVDCTRCTELAGTRTQTVFGVGRPDARLCFFGEAPGADEDASGEPFVGRAGQLLTKIIEACTLSRDDVYILNVLKCRPPGNRVPLPAEVANCRSFFERQFATIAPEFICCLGTTAAQSLLQTTEPIGGLRGRWFSFGSAQVICTYHPSYLLRNPAAKRHVWDDMKLLMAKMGLPVPE
ncbi:uracil-DNA glycosylase [bacterium]|nr:uracil-DNA glycosylase [bacterium]